MNEFEKQYYEDSSFWESGMLQDKANLVRFSSTESLIPEDVSTLLDAGCGNGVFVNYLLEKRPDLTIHALDRSVKALQYVKSNKTEGDIVQMPFPDKSFDCVTCLEVLEHLPLKAFSSAISEIFRVSKKYIIISVPFNEILENSHTQCPSCKSIFNYELHLQSFGEEKFRSMFSEFGFSAKVVKKEGPSVKLVGHDIYRRIFYKEQFKQWKSPICPLCGFASEKERSGEEVNGAEVISAKQRILSTLSYLPKKVWPKTTSYYWIIGLFEKC